MGNGKEEREAVGWDSEIQAFCRLHCMVPKSFFGKCRLASWTPFPAEMQQKLNNQPHFFPDKYL